MPDTVDFQRDDEQHRATNGWGEAFAHLPQDAPDAGGWQRVQARLPARATRSRKRWPLWLAAASLAVVAVIPLRMLPQAVPDAPRAPQATIAAATPSVTAAAPTTTTPSVTRDVQPAPAPVAKRDTPRSTTRTPPSQRPVRTAAQPADATRIAASNASTPVELEPLYAQSARLESLLALARDERVASGTSAALSDALDNRVAAIDATLIQPGLSDAQRIVLWGQRVEALQQLVGIETTNRLYAARGQRYDAALVSID